VPDSVAVLAGVVTFNPSPAQVDRILATLPMLSPHAVVFDNTPDASVRALLRNRCEAGGIKYITRGTNVGTAAALNEFVRIGTSLCLGWLIYLDQDTEIGPGFVDQLASERISAADEVAAIGASLSLASDPPPGDAVGFTEALALIASGTHYRLSALRDVDGADESFQLDLVDHELCMRLRAASWRVLINRERAIVHEIGEGPRRLKGSRVELTSHPVWRRRAMWRNSVCLVRRYFRVFPAECIRHVAGRLFETVVGAVVLRDRARIGTACAGLIDGIRADNTRVGLRS